MTEYPILVHGLAIGILPAHILGKNGTSHLLGVFGTTKTRRSSGFGQPLFERSELGCLPYQGSWIIPFLSPSEISDACCLASGSDARINRQALFEQSELVCPLKFASVPLNMARLGVNGFGYFSRKKSSSLAGAKPGNTINRLDIVF